jgi:hypothetical protein
MSLEFIYYMTLCCLSAVAKLLSEATHISFFYYGLLAGTIVLLPVMLLARGMVITRKKLLSKEELLGIIESEKRALELKNRSEERV